MKFLSKLITLWMVLAFAGCGWLSDQRKTVCTINQYAEANVANQTARDLQVAFCSSKVSTGNLPQTVSAQSQGQGYCVLVGRRQQETVIPYADSNGDGCLKIVGWGEKVADAVPVLSAADLATTKTCSNGANYIFVDASQSCPDGYSVFDQTNVVCK